MSTDPLDISSSLVNGLSHISLVASTPDLFYSTIQFYESLGFNTVSLVCNSLCDWNWPCSLIVLNRVPLIIETTTFVLTQKRKLGCTVGEKRMAMTLLSKSDWIVRARVLMSFILSRNWMWTGERIALLLLCIVQEFPYYPLRPKHTNI